MASPPVGSAGTPPRVTRDNFYQSTQNCRVRRVQKRYEEIAEQAKQNNRPIAVEMQRQGFVDFKAFNKSCPQFDLWCYPMEFAELGSGAVLYFHFLILLAILFALVFLLQLPVLITYSQENWLMGWQWTTWTKAYSTSDPCKCIGRNDGILGLPDFPEDNAYGTSCLAWDAEWQTGLPPCTLAPCTNPGKWACRKWCFASKECPTKPNADVPSLTNVIFHGLVRAYSTCASEADEALVAGNCTGELSEDVMFNETGAEFGGKSSIGSHWMTPGNFGPHLAEADWIPTIYIICVLLVGVIVIVGHQRMVLTDIKVDANTTSPNDFALMIRGLPKTATDENALMEWFSRHALPDKSADIVKVVIAFDVEEFRDNIAKLKALRESLRPLAPDDPEVKDIKKQMADITLALNSASPDQASRLQGSGLVVVIFRHQEDMRTCLHRFNTFWARRFYCDAEDASWLWVGNRFWKSGPLPMFPLGDQPACRIQVERAANPGDINWMELGVAPSVKYKMLAKNNGLMFILVVITFFIVYGLNRLTDVIEVEGAKNETDHYGFQALALLPAMFVVLMNIGLQMVARTLGKQEFHETKTEEEFSQAWKISIGMIANTAGVLLFLHSTPREWYELGGLIDNTGVMLLMNVLIPPFIPLLDIKYMVNYWKRRKLTDKVLDHMNEVIHRCAPQPKTPPEAQELKQVTAQIEWFKRNAFEPSEMDAPRRFADALKTTFCCLFFAPVMPMVSLLGFIGIVVQYAVGKYAILRVYKRPDKPTNCSMALFSVKLIKHFGPAALAIAAFVFLTPSWKDKGLMWSTLTTTAFITLGILFFPISLVGRCFRRIYVDDSTGDMDYYKAQYMWPKDMKYHKDHFLYAKLPDSVNPEYLKPGTSAAVALSDVKAGYTAAAASAADAAATGGSTPGPALRDGRIMEAGVAAADGPGTSASAGDASKGGPAPAVYGVMTSVGGTPGGRGDQPPSRSAPAVVAAPTATPVFSDVAPPAAAGATAPAVIWEFQIRDDHWKQFAADCHAHIESKYQEHQTRGGAKRINVHTSGMQLSIDFGRMTQMKTDTHKVSAIRRRTS